MQRMEQRWTAMGGDRAFPCRWTRDGNRAGVIHPQGHHSFRHTFNNNNNNNNNNSALSLHALAQLIMTPIPPEAWFSLKHACIHTYTEHI